MTEAHEAALPEKSPDQQAADQAIARTALKLAVVMRIFERSDGDPLALYADELEGLGQILSDAASLLTQAIPLDAEVVAQQMCRAIGVIRFTHRALRAASDGLVGTFDFEEAQGLVSILAACQAELLAAAGAEEA
jgi:hypothetical protein